MSKAKNDKCQHHDLYIDCSPEAGECGFGRPPAPKRLAAATASGRVSKDAQCATDGTDFNNGETFPGPLCLPDEALTIEPNDSPQSFRSWLQTAKGHGTMISSRRQTLYVIPPPDITPEVKGLMSGWANPKVPKGEETPGLPKGLNDGRVDDLCEYLQAFYHLMPVKVLESKYRWRKWDGTSRKGEKHIGIETPGPQSELVGVRYRSSLDGIATAQVCLSDILDAMIARVPPDAHAITMIVPFDTYEDEDDDFCCGRAFGGSRISIVSSFRYHPCLDFYSGIDLEHMWPASHCKSYVDELCGGSRPPLKRKKVANPAVVTRKLSSPIGAALEAAASSIVPRTKADYNALWFSRVARTLSHEVGHCVMLDHCVYFSCVMQGTAGMAEDVRQPPFLCPVCVEKLSYNVLCLIESKGSNKDKQRSWILGQHRAMKAFCEKWRNVGMFAGYEAWLDKRIESMVKVKGETAETKASIRAKPQPSSRVFAQWLDDDL